MAEQEATLNSPQSSGPVSKVTIRVGDKPIKSSSSSLGWDLQSLFPPLAMGGQTTTFVVMGFEDEPPETEAWIRDMNMKYANLTSEEFFNIEEKKRLKQQASVWLALQKVDDFHGKCWEDLATNWTKDKIVGNPDFFNPSPPTTLKKWDFGGQPVPVQQQWYYHETPAFGYLLIVPVRDVNTLIPDDTVQVTLSVLCLSLIHISQGIVR